VEHEFTQQNTVAKDIRYVEGPVPGIRNGKKVKAQLGVSRIGEIRRYNIMVLQKDHTKYLEAFEGFILGKPNWAAMVSKNPSPSSLQDLAREHGDENKVKANVKLLKKLEPQALRKILNEGIAEGSPPEGWKTRRLAADSSALSGSSSFLLFSLFSMIPLLFLVYRFFSRRFRTPAKRSRKQSTYRCHYPENAEDFSDVEPEIDMV